MSVLARIAGVFVQPEGAVGSAAWAPPVAPAVSATAWPQRLAVLCAPRDARVAGGAAGLALLRAGGAQVAVVAQWGGDGPRSGRAPASPAAARVAAVLVEHGLDARPRARLVRVALPAHEEDAARAAQVVVDEAPVPVALVVAGARGPALDAVLPRFDLALAVARTDDDGLELARLAAAGLTAAGMTAAAVELSVPPLAAALARAGLMLCEPLRGRFAEALALEASRPRAS